MQTVQQRREMNSKCITLYNKIKAFIEQFGYALNYRKICVLMDIKSTSQVRGLVTVLERWHWITMDNGKCRTVRLIRPTEIEVPDAIRAAATKTADRLNEKWLAEGGER